RRLAAAVVLAALAVAAAVLIPQVSFPLAAGAVAAFAAGVTAVGRRRSLLSGLVQVRAAYHLRAVSEDGVRFANVDRRHRLARWVRTSSRSRCTGSRRAGTARPPDSLLSCRAGGR